MQENFADLKKLYPEFSPEQLAAAKDLLDAYLLLAWEIWEEHSTGGTNPHLTPVGTGSTI